MEQRMEIVIVQGMACLGKSTLCKQLEEDLPNCKHFSLDEYKENMWDKFGFDSVEQREYQSELARVILQRYKRSCKKSGVRLYFN